MFDFVKAAIADVENAENTYESKAAADDAAQSALVNAQSTAQATSADKSGAKSDLVTKLEAMKSAISAFEAELNPTA